MNHRTIVAILVVTVLSMSVWLWAQPAADSPLAGPIARPNTAIERGGCITSDCHANIKSHEVVHGPINVDACDACHQLADADAHRFEQTRPKEQLCTFCHEVDTQGAAVVHKPLTTGDCLACHDPHGSANRQLLKAETVDLLCQSCHEDVIGGLPEVHGPVAAGVCGACHLPHTSKHKGLLSAEGTELCLQCHVTTKAQLEKMRFVHGPVAVDCQACHDAHASSHKMMLSKEPQELCRSCHEEIEHLINTATRQHAAVVTDRACLNCHDAHASDYPRVLRDDMKTLCFECHDKRIKLEDGSTLANIKAVLETGTSLHGPVAQDNCAACHEIHGGSHFRLLIKEYPPQFYAPFQEESYALCFSCHDKELVLEPQTETLTDFRNGSMNLHFLHVNKVKKGRTCRACHETHASKRAKHIRESVPFGTGGWMLPVNFQKKDSGGSCAPGCHLPYEYNRVDPVAHAKPEAPAEQKPADQPKPVEPPADKGAES